MRLPFKITARSVSDALLCKVVVQIAFITMTFVKHLTAAVRCNVQLKLLCRYHIELGAT